MDSILVYADGSKCGTAVGFAVVFVDKVFHRRLPLYIVQYILLNWGLSLVSFIEYHWYLRAILYIQTRSVFYEQLTLFNLNIRDTLILRELLREHSVQMYFQLAKKFLTEISK